MTDKSTFTDAEWHALTEARLLAKAEVLHAKQEMRDGKRVVRLEWHTAFAGDEPIRPTTSSKQVNRQAIP